MRSFAIEDPGSPVPPLYATLIVSIIVSILTIEIFQASRAHNLWVHHKVLAAAMSARDENNNR